MKSIECKQCGKCCSFEIPLTLLDIDRIVEHTGISLSDFFSNYIQKEKSEKSGLYKILKKNDGRCVFQDDHRKCSIHVAKPNICRFYNCNHSDDDKEMPWTLRYSKPDDRVKIWEQSVAVQLTKNYINQYGTGYNKNAFEQALESIKRNIITKKSQKIKLGRNSNREPVCIIYDCSICSEHGKKASETPVTLTDIVRITRHVKLNLPKFFKEKLDTELSTSGIFKLKRSEQCIFYHDKKHCTVSEAKPLHCKFIPCLQKTNNSSEFDCYYLGSGTIQEQYEHQVALLFTKDYIQKNGIKYIKTEFNDSIKQIQDFLASEKNIDLFKESIISYRYIDDTDLLSK